jgi:F1F0 ATPase subunit 2
MTDTPAVLMAAVAGAGLGAIHFVGLWWTAQHTASLRRPVAWILVGALLRMSMTLGGFYLVAGGNLVRLLFCLLGFVVARAAVTWLTRLAPPKRSAVSSRALHAP